MKKANLKTSFRDLLITGWLIVFGVTVMVVAFLPDYADERTASLLRFGGLAFVGAMGGILMAGQVGRLGHSTSRNRKIAMTLFVASMVALVPVMFVTFSMPWAALFILTLFYARWKWALVTAAD